MKKNTFNQNYILNQRKAVLHRQEHRA